MSRPETDAANEHGATLAAMFSRRLRLRSERGTTLVEVIVAMVILAVMLSFATDIYLSNARAQRRLQEWIGMIDQSDLAKTWVANYLQAADAPLLASSATAIEFTAGGHCYTLSLNTTNKTIDQQANASSTCVGIGSVTPSPVASWVDNAGTSGDPLFTFKDAAGAPTTTTSAVREVDMSLRLSQPTALHTLPVTRIFSIIIG
jgi:prepilin-type N-terminal cleavage/methylation domain-containing protein